MIKLATSNLLAEKPYRRYGRVELLDFAKRSNKFLIQIQELMPDVILLQEVDELWREYIESNIIKLSYDVHFGSCWSSGLAIIWKEDMMKPSNAQPINFPEAGILSIELINSKLNEQIRFVNLHAPWGKAERFDKFYGSVVAVDSPILIAGDFNTNSPNSNYFFGKLFNSERAYKEFTESVRFTARNVKTNNEEKLDYIIGKNISGKDTCVYPKELSLLLPHCQGGDYSINDEKNHYSDHALLISNIFKEG